MSICLVEPYRNSITFSGSRQDLWILHQGKLEVIKGDKKGVGYCNIPFEQSYSNKSIKLKPDMDFFLFTDGVNDQIGGEKRRAYGKKRLQEVLLSSKGIPLKEKGYRILADHKHYQGKETRRDDLSMIAFRPLSSLRKYEKKSLIKVNDRLAILQQMKSARKISNSSNPGVV